MDVSCPSLPPKILVPNETDAEFRPNEQTTVYMAAHGCHFVECFWYVLLVIIEVSSSQCATQVIAQPSLYKTGPPILSRTFSKRQICEHEVAQASNEMLAVRLLVSDVDGNLCDNRLSVVFVVITNAALIFLSPVSTLARCPQVRTRRDYDPGSSSFTEILAAFQFKLRPS